MELVKTVVETLGAADDVKNCFRLSSLMLNLGLLTILWKILLSLFSCSLEEAVVDVVDVLIVDSADGRVVKTSLRSFKLGNFKLDLISLNGFSVATVNIVGATSSSLGCFTTTFSFSESEI